ncbi:CHAT domain-containing protein [Alteromonas sp. 14N.309.X.WAT.G.H12]
MGYLRAVRYVFAMILIHYSGIARASSEVCAEFEPTWQQYTRVAEDNGAYFHCTAQGAVALTETAPDTMTILSMLADFDTRLLSDKNTLSDTYLEKMQELQKDSTMMQKDIALRLIVGLLANMNYQQASQGAAQFLQQWPTASAGDIRTAKLVQIQSEFALQHYRQTLTLCHKMADESAITARQQQVVLLTYCGFSKVLSNENPAQLEEGFLELKQANNLKNKHTNPLLCAEIHNGFASYYRFQSDLSSTQIHLNSGIDCLVESRGAREDEMRDDLTNNLAWVYRRQGNLPGYLSALRASVFQHTHNLVPEKLSVSYSNLGRAYLLVGDLAKSERYYLQALKYTNLQVMPEDYIHTLLSLVRLRGAQQDWKSARYYLDEVFALPLNKKLRILAQIFDAQWRAYAQAGSFDEDEYKHVIDDIDNTFPDTEVVQLYSDWLVVLQRYHRLDLAQTLIARIESFSTYPLSVKLAIANIKLALLLNEREQANTRTQIDEIFEQAFSEIVDASTQFKSNDVGMSWLSQSRSLINRYLAWLLPSNDEQDIEKALILSERFASIMFQRHRMSLSTYSSEEDDSALTSPWDLGDGVPGQYTNKQWLVHDVETEQMLLSQQALTSVLTSEKWPSLTDLRHYLGSKRAILKIFSLEDKHCAYLITANYTEGSCSANEDNITDEIGTLLFRYHGLDTVYLLPEGQWRNMSFAALQDKTQTRYLGQELSLIRVVSLLDYFQSETKSSSEPLAVTFTNPANPTPEQAKNTEAMQWRAGFPQLPWTALASQTIADAFPDLNVISYNDNQATNEHLVSSTARHAKLLHVGSHAFYSPETPDMVGLVTAYNGSSAQHQGVISYEALFSHQFSNQLVVISACETEMGRSYRGIGMRSLSRGFLYQGAGGTISTLWKVPDRATAEFMAFFYQNVAENGGDIAKALLVARQQLSQKRRFKDPRYWAGFVFTVSGYQYETLDF